MSQIDIPKRLLLVSKLRLCQFLHPLPMPVLYPVGDTDLPIRATDRKDCQASHPKCACKMPLEKFTPEFQDIAEHMEVKCGAANLLMLVYVFRS